MQKVYTHFNRDILNCYSVHQSSETTYLHEIKFINHTHTHIESIQSHKGNLLIALRRSIKVFSKQQHDQNYLGCRYVAQQLINDSDAA